MQQREEGEFARQGNCHSKACLIITLRLMHFYIFAIEQIHGPYLRDKVISSWVV